MNFDKTHMDRQTDRQTENMITVTLCSAYTGKG